MRSYSDRRRRREVEVPELNVTPFMNLMIVLVPVLLLSLVFTHTTVIELDFPPEGDSVANNEIQHLEIRILASELVVADQRGVIRRLPMIQNQHDYQGLNEVMRSVKQQMPSKRDAVILLQPNTEYQSLVFVMDSVRAFETLELFPDMSLGDAPEGSNAKLSDDSGAAA